MPEHQEADIAYLLQHCRSVAVVGLSPRPERDSHEVAHYLQQQGWRIIPVNPNASTILGETAYPSLEAAAAVQPIGLVNVFRTSAEVPAVVDAALAVGATALWLQLGVRHDGAAARARAAGLRVVQDRCLLVEHRRAARS